VSRRLNSLRCLAVMEVRPRERVEDNRVSPTCHFVGLHGEVERERRILQARERAFGQRQGIVVQSVFEKVSCGYNPIEHEADCSNVDHGL
jgi:hypothetical protein